MFKARLLNFRLLTIAILVAVLLPGAARAQQFFSTGNQKGNLMAGFRKTGSHAGSNEVVVLLGNITNFIGLPIGTTTNITVYGSNVLAYAFQTNLGNLQWSAFSTFKQLTTSNGAGPWVTPVGSFQDSTSWYTQPRTNVSIQTSQPPRWSVGAQQGLRSSILGAGAGAVAISSAIGGTNAYNNLNLVVEPVSYNSYDLTVSIGDTSNPNIGDFDGYSGGQCLPYTVENVTSNTFSSPQVSDLYQSTPIGEVDPYLGTTNGNCYFLGYFTLNTDGTMSFTRQTNSVTVQPPPAPSLTIARVGNVSTISFGTTNGATYNLIYNTVSGLNTARSTWPVLGVPVIGNGGVTNFTDSAATSGRVYSVTAH